jgi:BASS family bile acid:Na+ symporter
MGTLAEIFLPAALAFIMFCLGLGLTASDFRQVLRHPRDFIVGAFCQVVLLPLVAFVLVSMLAARPELAMGVMLLAAAPGGVVSNLFTRHARGDVALSVSLTAFVSLICAITVPPVIYFSSNHFLGDSAQSSISVLGLSIRLFIMATVPLLTGMAVRYLAERCALAAEPFLIRLSTIVFVLVIATALYAERSSLPGFFAMSGVLSVLLNVAMLLVAGLVSYWLASGPKQRTAISIECGVQNGAVAITIATTVFGNGPFAIPAVTYSLVMYVTTTMLVYYYRSRPFVDYR